MKVSHYCTGGRRAWVPGVRHSTVPMVTSELIPGMCSAVPCSALLCARCAAVPPLRRRTKPVCAEEPLGRPDVPSLPSPCPAAKAEAGMGRGRGGWGQKWGSGRQGGVIGWVDLWVGLGVKEGEV